MVVASGGWTGLDSLGLDTCGLGLSGSLSSAGDRKPGQSPTSAPGGLAKGATMLPQC